MIAYLKGKILKRADKGIVLSTGQIGYFVHLTKNFLSKLIEGKEIEVFVHNQIREDASDLYGFRTFEELSFFKTLINVKGIGPKVSMEILNLPEEKIKAAIATEDLSFLSKIPGIGKKTAQRLILELKGEIANIGEKEMTRIPDKTTEDVVSALTKLGYQRHQIKSVLKSIPEEIEEAEEIISYFLKQI